MISFADFFPQKVDLAVLNFRVILWLFLLNFFVFSWWFSRLFFVYLQIGLLLVLAVFLRFPPFHDDFGGFFLASLQLFSILSLHRHGAGSVLLFWPLSERWLSSSRPWQNVYNVGNLTTQIVRRLCSVRRHDQPKINSIVGSMLSCCLLTTFPTHLSNIMRFPPVCPDECFIRIIIFPVLIFDSSIT